MFPDNKMLAIWSQIGSKFDQILTTKLCHPPLSMNLSTKPARHALPTDWWQKSNRICLN